MYALGKMMHPFLELCREVENKTRSACYPEEYESEYKRVLDYIQTHPEERAFIADTFSRGITTGPGASHYLVRFCMRSLRWPEIKTAAEIAYNQGGNAWYATEMKKLLEIYDGAAKPTGDSVSQKNG